MSWQLQNLVLSMDQGQHRTFEADILLHGVKRHGQCYVRIDGIIGQEGIVHINRLWDIVAVAEALGEPVSKLFGDISSSVRGAIHAECAAVAA
jgi:hypothetical protein